MIGERYDCVVIGGGPAGSTAAALIAESGRSTLLVEREKMPRFHVGESLMPETYWTLERLGLLEKLKQSEFVKKYSVQFISHKGNESAPFFFQQHDPRESSQTWQVERATFDKMLFDRAAELGAECRDQTRVLDVLTEQTNGADESVSPVTGVRLQASDGSTHDVSSSVVIDATGQQALLANRFQIKQEDPRLRKAAIWGYYRRARREPGEHGGATIIMLTETKESWFWYIPLSNDITSIGVVGDRDYLFQESRKPAAIFERELAKCPRLVDRLVDAEMNGDLRVAKEFSYTTSQHAGQGWVLVGDAFGFIDPIYSSGVYFALRSGELAADAVIEGFEKNDLSGQQLGKWTDGFKSGTKWIRKLVDAYYSNDFSFGRFLKDHPQHHANLTDLLIGRIFTDNAGDMFKDMDPAIAAVSQSGAPPHVR